MKVLTKALLLATLAILMFAVRAKAVPVPWDVGLGANGHTYELITEAKTWMDAEAAAMAMGGYLATVTSKEENAFVRALLPDGVAAWLGGYQDQPGYSEPAGGWKWVTGELFSYTNWKTSGFAEPNNTCSSYGIDILGCEDHLGMSNHATFAGQWYDAHNNNMYSFVVEAEHSVPEPSAILLLGTGLTGVIGFACRRRRA